MDDIPTKYLTLEQLMAPSKTPLLTTATTPMELWIPREGLAASVEHSLKSLHHALLEGQPTFEELTCAQIAIRQREELLAWLKIQLDPVVYVVFYPIIPEEDEDGEAAGSVGAE